MFTAILRQILSRPFVSVVIKGVNVWDISAFLISVAMMLTLGG